MNISKPWANVQITYFGENKKIQMTSLRKKIHDHKISSVHKAATNVLTAAKEKTIELSFTAAFEHDKEITSKIFRTAYKIAKKNQAFHDFESEIDLQEVNGSDMDRILHSTKCLYQHS